jgi:hypothetical protein
MASSEHGFEYGRMPTNHVAVHAIELCASLENNIAVGDPEFLGLGKSGDADGRICRVTVNIIYRSL